MCQKVQKPYLILRLFFKLIPVPRKVAENKTKNLIFICKLSISKNVGLADLLIPGYGSELKLIRILIRFSTFADPHHWILDT